MERGNLTKSSVLDGKAKRARSYKKFCARIHDQKQITDSSHPAFCVACMFEGLVHEHLANCCWDVVAYHLVELGFERSRGVFLCPMGMVLSPRDVQHWFCSEESADLFEGKGQRQPGVRKAL